jgi:hypothetical protein
MARAKVTHSQDGVTITFRGDPKSPEPSTGVIRFPGGHVEVTRCTDGTYWAHLEVDEPANTVDSRIDHDYEGYRKMNGQIPDLPEANHVKKIAIRVDGPFRENGQ